jgi:hypothetical protein
MRPRPKKRQDSHWKGIDKRELLAESLSLATGGRYLLSFISPHAKKWVEDLNIVLEHPTDRLGPNTLLKRDPVSSQMSYGLGMAMLDFQTGAEFPCFVNTAPKGTPRVNTATVKLFSPLTLDAFRHHLNEFRLIIFGGVNVDKDYFSWEGITITRKFSQCPDRWLYFPDKKGRRNSVELKKLNNWSYMAPKHRSGLQFKHTSEDERMMFDDVEDLLKWTFMQIAKEK